MEICTHLRCWVQEDAVRSWICLWGDSSFMMPLHLRDKPAHGPCLPKPQSSVQHPQTKFGPRSWKRICGQFNATNTVSLHMRRACCDDHSFTTSAWERWLHEDDDKDFILRRIRHVFHWYTHISTLRISHLHRSLITYPLAPHTFTQSSVRQ